MINLFLQNLTIITVFLIIILIFFSIVLLSLKIVKRCRRNDISIKLEEIYSKIRNDIDFAVVPKFINISPSGDDFMQFALEIWRIEQRLAKLEKNLPENQKKGLENSIQRLKRYLEKYDIEVIDYTKQKFNDGLNLDVLSVEKDSAITEPIIKETIEPTIMYRGQVAHKAKIIVLTK